MLVGGPEPERWTGLAGMAASWRDWLSTWEHVRFEAEEYRELDDERISCWSMSAADAARRVDWNCGRSARRE